MLQSDTLISTNNKSGLIKLLLFKVEVFFEQILDKILIATNDINK